MGIRNASNRISSFLLISFSALFFASFLSHTITHAQTQIPEPASDACITAKCHSGIAQEKFTHGPVKAGKCIVCHGTSEKHLKKPKRNKFGKIKNLSATCYSCHDQFKAKKFTHKPLEEGECTACHDSHGSPHKYQLTAQGGKLCFNCHDKKLFKEKYVHGPAAVGGCAICHDPHTADYKNNLKAEGADLCFMCHTEKKKKFEQAEFTHKPVTESCTGCHNPHAAPKKFMLSDDPPFMCYNCHKDKKAAIEDAPVKHGAITEERSCMNCHDPHVSNVAKNLLMPPLDLCMSCHDKALTAPDGSTLTNMQELLTTYTDHHGPIKQKDCSGCHNPHGSENFRILRNPYPASFYKPYNPDNYQLCFGCHEQSVVQNPRTTKLTNFRNGNINLHYLHVNKREKGRTCRACHETHASNYPKHIREAVSFGMWDLPLNFEKTETGGGCTPGCHQLKQYDRVNEISNIEE
jgi:predicted CXXCH cytochrome family protein